MKYNFSLHQIERKDQCPFDEAAYSYFKYGDTKYASLFAASLFEGFIQQFKDLILAQSEIIILPSPYHSIPTASNFLCSYFKKNLNHFLFENGKKACVESKIYRQQTYTQDYGNMDYEQRLHLISNDTYYIDKHFIEGKFCIFLDDIKITGSHEKTVLKILDQYEVKGDFCFIYFAELINKEIHPNIENHFNYFAVNSVNDIIAIMKQPTFQFNTRIVKYILIMKENNFELLIENIAQDQQKQLLELAISNNYHQIKEYQNNINQLNNSKLWLSTYKKGKEKTLMLQNLP